MATRRVDTRFCIYDSNDYKSIGLYSRFLTVPHPGTMNTIEGWKWDERRWASDPEIKALAYAPSIWNAESTTLTDDFFQSGIGTNDDFLMLDVFRHSLADNQYGWVPRVLHGHYFVNQHPWFLYSDWSVQLTMQGTNVNGGRQFIDLPIGYMPLMPITVCRYDFNNNTGAYDKYMEFTPVLEEDVDGDELQYYLDTSFNPARLYLSNTFLTPLGDTTYDVPGGLLDLSSVGDWELLGYSGGAVWETFRSRFSPIDSSQSLEILSYGALDDFISWTILDEGEEFDGSNAEVKINLAKGIIEFGNYDGVTGDGMIPPIGHHILLRYTPGLSVCYEPYFSQTYIDAFTADTNPLNNNIFAGFVQITRTEPDPYQVVLEVLDEEVDENDYYSMAMGSNISRLMATVTDRRSLPMQNVLVTFDNLPPYTGSFGNQSSIVGITDADGHAYATFNAPLTLEDMARVADIQSSGPGHTVINVENVIIPDDVHYDNILIYAVYNDDVALGIPGDITTPASPFYAVYTAMLAEEGIVGGVTADETWEAIHRTIYSLGQPTSVEDTDLIHGHKRLLITQNKAFAVDVHGTGWPTSSTPPPPTAVFSTDVFVPLHPYDTATENYTDGTNLVTLDYDIEIDEPDPGVNNIKSYLVVADALATIQARASSYTSNREIYSNIIGIRVSIASEAGGTLAGELSDVALDLLSKAWDITLFSDGDINLTNTFGTLNEEYLSERLVVEGTPEVYAAWFKRTKLGATDLFVSLAAWSPHPWDPSDNPFYVGLPLTTYALSGYAELPIGFRIRSSGSTLASVLSQAVYLDPNDHLPGNYWD